MRELNEHEQALQRDMVAMRYVKRGIFKEMKGYIYCGMEDFLLQHGKWYTPRPRPADVKQGLPKACFGNAIFLAAERGYRYVEGLAFNTEVGHVLAIHHGWNVDPDGNMIDTTWPDIGTAYCGVEFSLGRADHATWEDDYTVLDNPRNHHALYMQIWHGEDWNKVWPESEALRGLRAALAGDLSLINALVEGEE